MFNYDLINISMISPHISVSFKFNNESLTWLSENIAIIMSDFDKNFPESGGPIYNKETTGSKGFQLTPPAIQVRKFLYNIGLSNTHIQMFGYKVLSKSLTMENVHIDTPGYKPLPGRFNILVEGNSNSRMHWWDIDVNHPKVICADVPGGKRWQIRGATKQKQLSLIENPDYSSGTLSIIQETGDFVKTDVAHCIERDGQRRIIISAQIHHSWEEITEKVHKWKNQ
jgi:hypothetical protein